MKTVFNSNELNVYRCTVRQIIKDLQTCTLTSFVYARDEKEAFVIASNLSRGQSVSCPPLFDLEVAVELYKEKSDDKRKN